MQIAADEVAATGGDEYKGYSVPTTTDYANEILDAAVVNALDLKKVLVGDVQLFVPYVFFVFLKERN